MLNNNEKFYLSRVMGVPSHNKIDVIIDKKDYNYFKKKIVHQSSFFIWKNRIGINIDQDKLLKSKKKYQIIFNIETKGTLGSRLSEREIENFEKFDFFEEFEEIQNFEKINEIIRYWVKFPDFAWNYLELDNVAFQNCLKGRIFDGIFYKSFKLKNSNMIFASWEENIDFLREDDSYECEDIKKNCSSCNCNLKGYCCKKSIGKLKQSTLKIFFNDNGDIINVVEEKKYITE